MSDSVKKIMDRLFGGDEADENIRALREEIENNCEEHYSDLIRQGYGEEEAAGEIAKSLQGMEDVVAGMRKETKSAEPEQTAEPAGNAPKKAETEAEGRENEEPVSGEGHLVFPAVGLDALKIQAPSDNLVFGVSDDKRIHVIWDPESPRRVQSERSGSVLRVSVINDPEAAVEKDTEPSGNCFRDERGNFSLNLSDILNSVRKAINIGLQKFIPTVFRVEIPEGLCPELDASTRSGNIRIMNLSLQKATLRSGSGDIEMDQAEVRENLNCATTSGDVSVSAPAEKTVISSISGDVRYTGVTGELRLQSTSGDIKIMTECETGTASTVSGDIDAKVRGARSLSLRSTSGDVDLGWENDAPTRFETSSVSGDISNRAANIPGADTTVRIKTISGDITIR